ncbi:MAG: hypothetical protein JXR31_02760 [Prolixibacteraceae bacterium]|nr:hypothetical protein [Prolixibacteraceae bacterium]MBN2773143.1 hypothetical protein [Prolixibacteraceae bacterium]
MKWINYTCKGVLTFLGFMVVITSVHAQIIMVDNTGWITDFDFVVNSIKTNHPNPYFRISREEFEAFAEKQKKVVENSHSHEESLIAVMKVVAKLRDGHTQIYPENNFGTDILLPLRTYVFEDGVFIISTIEEYKTLMGARLLAVNGIEIEEVEERLNSIIPSDNDFGRKNYLPMYLSNTAFLKGLGIIETKDTVWLKYITKDGIISNAGIEPVKATSSNEWIKRSLNGSGGFQYLNPFSKRIPEYLKTFYEDYVNFKYLFFNNEKALYVQINQLADSPQQSFSDFQSRLWDYFDANADHINSLILDLRFNTGGNGSLIPGFVKELIKREEILQHRNFSVLIGRQTFSAAIMLVSQLKTYTEATFFGEPMGGPLHLWSTALQLGTVPSGNFEFHVSSSEFFMDLPAGKEFIFPPQVPFPVISSDFFSGEDKLLNFILNNDPKQLRFNLKEELLIAGSDNEMPLQQAYSKGVINEENLQAVITKARRLNHNWRLHTNECGFHPYGSQIKESYLKYELLLVARAYADANKNEYAGIFYKLETILLPDYPSGWLYYAEFLNTTGETEKAIKCYKKTLELNPQSKTAAEQLKKLIQE